MKNDKTVEEMRLNVRKVLHYLEEWAQKKLHDPSVSEEDYARFQEIAPICNLYKNLDTWIFGHPERCALFLHEMKREISKDQAS